MFWNVFKKTKFWVSLLIVSIIGMILGIYLENLSERELKNSNQCFANTYPGKKGTLVIKNIYYKDKYLKYHRDGRKDSILNFPPISLARNQRVFVIDTLERGEFFKIKYKASDNVYGKNEKWMYAWIFHKYVGICESSPPSAPL